MPHILVEIQVQCSAQHITADVDIRAASLHAVIHNGLVIQKQLPRGEPLPIDLHAQGIQQIPIRGFRRFLHFRHERPPVEIAEGNGRQRRLGHSFLRQSVQRQHQRQRQQNRKQLLHSSASLTFVCALFSIPLPLYQKKHLLQANMRKFYNSVPERCKFAPESASSREKCLMPSCKISVNGAKGRFPLL